MKKMLNLLAALTVGVSTTSSVVACKSKVEDFKVVKAIELVNSTVDNNSGSSEKTEKYLNKFHVNTPSNMPVVDENGIETAGGMLNDIQGGFYDAVNKEWNVYFLYNHEIRYDENGGNNDRNGTIWYRVTTKDWIHWDYKGEAVSKYVTDWGDAASGSLYEDKDGDFAQAAIDAKIEGVTTDTKGYVAFTTGYGGDKGQNILASYSIDGAKFETLNDKQPILQNGKKPGTYPNFRDPFVFKKDNKFYMYVSEDDHFGVYESEKALGEYKHVGDYTPLHRMIECANLYEMNVTDENGKTESKWVMIYGGNGNNENGRPDKMDKLGTGTYYSVGHLNEKNVFVEEQEAKRLDFGADFYASKFWQDPTATDQKDYLIGTGWMSSWDYNTKTPNEGKWGNMSLARKVSLTKTGDEYGMTSSFLGLDDAEMTSSGDEEVLAKAKLSDRNFKLDLELKNVDTISNITEFSIGDNFNSNKIRLNFNKNTIHSIRTINYKPLKNNKGYTQLRKYAADIKGLDTVKIEFIIDTTTIEAIMPDGSVISMIKFPEEVSPETIKLSSSSELNLTYKYYKL
ncbi:levanase [Spiroplasma chinense]|uniref:Levanase n=1 Tax=Spiroplasma chinense TaxID=216932 RepID=A0A5B9Y5D6_9MOLU|nr:glycoside hydrolase family 32 protein [Spiroplasma chinense]QEH61926.1 levanase [Spiroplasma chinense]